MSALLYVILGVLVVALSVIIFALMPRHTHPTTRPRGYWDENAQRWTTTLPPAAPAPTPCPALIDLAPGIDLGLRDDCELLWAMPAYGETAADHTTTSEGD